MLVFAEFGFDNFFAPNLTPGMFRIGSEISIPFLEMTIYSGFTFIYRSIVAIMDDSFS